MKYFVIQAPNGLFYSDNQVVGWDDERIETDGQGKKSVHTRPLVAPVFHAPVHKMALKYETETDATDHFTHADLKDPDAFAGCKVLTIEF